jgi:hypothetical protein
LYQKQSFQFRYCFISKTSGSKFRSSLDHSLIGPTEDRDYVLVSDLHDEMVMATLTAALILL